MTGASPPLLPTNGDGIALSLVIPVYRSMDVLPKLVETIETCLANSDYSGRYEIVLVNDCSPDGSWAVIEELSATHPQIRGISLRKNAGQHNATMAGLKFARGEVIVIMDDDLQHPPEAITELARRIEDGADVCYTRYRNRKHAAWKRWGSWFNDRMAVHLINKPRGLYLSSFKALRRDVVETILLYNGPYPYVDALILNATNNITSIEIDHQARHAGESNYNLRRLVSLWLKMATGSSIFPLRLATISGFVLAAASLIFLMTVIFQKIMHPETQPGWTSVMATLLLIGGLQMVFLGIIGEYVGRIYLRLNNIPQFVVGKTTFEARN
ncbi:glycosyltransferase family 2 protein [Ancylobacter sp. A5.8]|uniref:glycosyltransferase family 2 protein n=1 Tax=Ancylobacter gelatini TaxID=2919920 RepID=UPI001F4EFE79|nr:glycosyltransferase family 2 protein [Ancylobacter gelatini]MCJ8142806.1 glycosyltransferase family 2 protein [Ancylobacter gelatini]